MIKKSGKTLSYRTPHRTAPHRTAPHHTTPHDTTPHHAAPRHTTPALKGILHGTSHITRLLTSIQAQSTHQNTPRNAQIYSFPLISGMRLAAGKQGPANCSLRCNTVHHPDCCSRIFGGARRRLTAATQTIPAGDSEAPQSLT